MAAYEINGGRPLNGTVTISGAKNAAVAILPATLLVCGKCRIENVPDISDVRILIDILDGMGADIAFPEPNVLEIDCSEVRCTEPDAALVKKIVPCCDCEAKGSAFAAAGVSEHECCCRKEEE